ncbi:hypothetical protein ACLI1C_15410 [Devosia sp. XGJD_8]|uniref:hypothetical protein n=1 Tax=Devosia sp. XGJD_8 TaxID=3391187 RepID=UPI0039856618
MDPGLIEQRQQNNVRPYHRGLVLDFLLGRLSLFVNDVLIGLAIRSTPVTVFPGWVSGEWMKRTILGVALAMILPAQSFALTVLCAESGSTGFNWRDGKWVNSDYALDQYIVQDVSEDPELSAYCESTEPTATANGASYAERCFNLSVVGEAKSSFSTTECRTFYDATGVAVSVRCGNSVYQTINFEPTGEFVLSRTFGIPDFQVPAPAQRDSLVLSVGKCSVIAP